MKTRNLQKLNHRYALDAGDTGGFLVIFLCFLLTSAGYLGWLYHLIDLKPAADVDLLTEVLGYLCQAAGMGVIAGCAYKKPEAAARSGFLISCLLFNVFLFPAVFLTNTTAVILCGFIMNLFCGCIAGYYLLDLASNVNAEKRATVFSLGYGTAALAMWLLSRVRVLSGMRAFLIPALCVLTTACIGIYLPRRKRLVSGFVSTGDSRGSDFTAVSFGEDPGSGENTSGSAGTIVLTACLTILLLSMVKNLGFSFPSADIIQGISLETTRMFYAAGLIISGFVCDRSRKYGALCCLISLVIPFVMLTLSGEPVSAAALWCLNYFTYGFVAVFRVILFSDIADAGRMLPLSVLGLFSGRIGDALGTSVYLLCGGRRSILIVITALLFMITMFLFFHLYQLIYMPEQVSQKSEEERFFAFAVRYDLSPREQDVLQRILQGDSNSEIAAELFVAESTVKYHVHNILQKTGCRNRNELMMIYRTS